MTDLIQTSTHTPPPQDSDQVGFSHVTTYSFSHTTEGFTFFTAWRAGTPEQIQEHKNKLEKALNKEISLKM